jgi:DNA-directed RNA polymerase IV and V subunit 2
LVLGLGEAKTDWTVWIVKTRRLKSYKAQVENKEITRRLKHKENINFGKVQSKRGKVDSLDSDGLPYVGASLQSGDIVIGKVTVVIGF